MSNIPITKLLRIPGITLIIGKTGSGKSHLLEYLIKSLYYEGYILYPPSSYLS